MRSLTSPLGALLAALTTVASTSALAAPAEAKWIPGTADASSVTLLVHSSADASDPAHLRHAIRRILDLNGSIVAAPELLKLGVTQVQVPDAFAASVRERLAAHPGVEAVEQAAAVAAFTDPEVEDEFRFAQDYLDRMAVPTAWETTRGSTETVIAVVDTGVRADHVELAGKLLPGYDVVNDDADPTDDNGHGTAVASVAAAVTDNGQGIAGVCPSCAVLPVKALGADARGTDADVAEGIVWAADHGADVINLSLGSATATETLRAAVDYAHAKGVILVAAAGNEGTTTPQYPAAFPHVISVGGIEDDGTRSANSSYGPTVDVAARNCVGVVAWNRSATDYKGLCGTSVAAPEVAGVTALLRTANPAADSDAVERALKATATSLPDGAFPGEPNAAAALTQDLVSPTVLVTSPATGAAVKGTVTVSAQASDDDAVSKVEFFDGTTSLGADTTAPYTVAWASGASTRTATLTVVATDAAGNQTTSAAVSPVVDNTQPTATVTGPVDGTAVAGSVPVSVTASDNVAVARVDVYNGSTWLGTAPAGETSGAYTLPVDTTKYSNGTQLALKAKVADTVGNVRYTTAVTVTVDNTNPTVTLANPTTDATPVRGTVTLTAQAADNAAVSKVEFYDGPNLVGTDTTAPYAVNWVTSGAGSSSLTAVAYDTAANKTTSAAVEVTVDNVVPTVSFTSPANGATVTGVVTFTVKADDNVAVSKVDLFDGATWLATSTAAPYVFTWDTSKVAKGLHTVKAKVTDTAGNVRYAQVVVTVF